jgi:hypothetical protein
MQSRIEGVSQGKGDDAQHEVRFSANIYNATPETVQTEIEIRDIFLRLNDISEASHAPDPDEIVPTYPITIGPESAERFELTVPMQEIYYFDYDNFDIGDRRLLNKTRTSYATGRYGLSSSLTRGGWATRYFKQPTGLSLKIDTTLQSYAEAETDEGDFEIIAKVKHVVKNTTDKTVKLAFVLPDGYGDVEILSSSIEQDAQNFNTWLLTLRPGQRRTLAYEVLFQD